MCARFVDFVLAQVIVELTDTENDQSQGDSEKEARVQDIIKPSSSNVSNTSETSGMSSEEEKQR